MKIKKLKKVDDLSIFNYLCLLSVLVVSDLKQTLIIPVKIRYYDLKLFKRRSFGTNNLITRSKTLKQNVPLLSSYKC